jgi:threonine dehydratase
MKQSLIDTHNRIKPFVHLTPVLTSTLIDEIAGCTMYFKCENFQRMGAFKMRGAVNAIMQLTDVQKAKGVVTHSSGNFAQALALAAKSLGITAYIVMPETAPSVKKKAVKGYGGIVIECPPTNEARVEYSAKLADEKGLSFIHPSDDMEVILGQGTAAMELFAEVENLDFVLTPVGGGGLVAGTILATQNFSKTTKVFGCEPALVDDAYRSLKSGKIETHDNENTIADGLKTHLGIHNFPIIKNGIEDILLVDEGEIIHAMKLVWERMKVIIEPSSAVSFAGLLRNKEIFKGKKVGIIISGGNVDLSKLPF